MRDHVVEQIAQFAGWNLVKRDNKAKVSDIGSYFDIVVAMKLFIYRYWSSKTQLKPESEFGIVLEQLASGKLKVTMNIILRMFRMLIN